MHAPEPEPTLSRRLFLQRTATFGGAVVAASSLASRAAAETGRAAGFNVVRTDRPALTHGVQSGDVGARSGVVWGRADREARMLVELSNTESFTGARRIVGPVADDRTDFTAQLQLRDLPPGQDVFYRVSFEEVHAPGSVGESLTGRFRTAPTRAADVSFVWSGDTAGQGWGINPDFGGMRTYEAMRLAEPDFFIHSGDTVYADNPIEVAVTLPDGTVWRNVVTEEKSKVAETLREYRGNHQYNLMDDNVRRFNAEVPVFAQWDDHEVTNNWYPGETLTAVGGDARYTVKDVDLLAARGRRAFLEYFPIREIPAGADDRRIFRKVSYGPRLDVFFIDMRTYRGRNTANDQTAPGPDTEILGARQLRWLERQLAASTATWKAIASDMPIGVVVPDGTEFEAVAQGDGPALGRELEIARLLTSIKRRNISNVVWFTADVHYTAAHEYLPDRARYQDFNPFWEFVSGPLSSGSFGPNRLDDTFGPQLRYVKAPPAPNTPPSAGFQFFGHTTISGSTGVMTVRLKDMAGDTLYSVDLVPEA